MADESLTPASKDARARDLLTVEMLQQQLLDPDVRRSPAKLRALLSTDFREFGASGRMWTLEEIVASLSAEQPASRVIDEFDARPLGPETVLATYRITRLDNDSGPIARSLRSSVWRREGGAWRMIFHQGTTQPD